MSNEAGAGVAEPPSEAGEGIGFERDDERGVEARADADGGEPKGQPRGVVREYFESLVVTAVMALFGMTFVVQAVKVPTGSMQNTILVGDHLLVNKFIFAPGPAAFFLPQREIRRGDIVVFKYPGKASQAEERFRDNLEVNDEREDNIPYKTNYVKRVVGLPGDHIEERRGEIYVNGQRLEERRVPAVNLGKNMPEGHPLHDAPLRVDQNRPASGEEPYDVFYPPERLRSDEWTFRGDVFDVPAGHYFVMGDNRDNSLDSRFWGYVPRDLVIGRAVLVYWSYDESAPKSDANFPLNVLSDFYNNTRWGRTGTLVR
jgi:signal peptidase I